MKTRQHPCSSHSPGRRARCSALVSLLLTSVVLSSSVAPAHTATIYGLTWIKLADPSITEITALAGDRQVFGRVFFGTAGRGVFVGQ